MKYGLSKGSLIIKLEEGEDVHESISTICDESGVRMGWVHSGIGILRDFTLGYYTREGYLKKLFDEPHELLSLSGTITLDEKVPIHLHASLANKEYGVVGGHLFSGTVTNLNEIMISKMPGDIWIGRSFNPETEYYELDIK